MGGFPWDTWGLDPPRVSAAEATFFVPAGCQTPSSITGNKHGNLLEIPIRQARSEPTTTRERVSPFRGQLPIENSQRARLEVSWRYATDLPRRQ